MKYIALSVKYVFKNFLRLLPFAAIPALFLAFAYDLPSLGEALSAMWEGGKVSFDRIYTGLSLFAGRLWWLKILSILLFILVLGILLSTLDRHMRIGKFSFAFWRRIDEVLVNILPVALIGILITEVFALICACVVMLIGLILPVAALPYVTVAFLALMALLWSLCIVLFINCVPCMIVQGYPMGEALGTSVRLVTKQLSRLFIAFLLPLIVFVPLAGLAAAYLGRWKFVVYFLCYAVLIMYFAAFSMSSYFDIFGYERHDIKYKLFK